jgi:predicted ATP-binding protein involved in virulence
MEIEYKPLIKKISVFGMLGFLNNEISLRKDGTTIIYGPNGCGKTTFFKIIHNLLNCDFKELFNYEFEKIRIDFEGDLFFEFSLDEVSEEQLKDKLSIARNIVSSISFDFYKNLKNFKSVEIKDNFSSIKIISTELISIFDKSENTHFRLFEKHKKNNEQNNQEIFEIINRNLSNQEVYFIDINRLIDIEKMDEIKKDNFYAIDKYAPMLSSIIRRAVSMSEVANENSANSFPKRIIEAFNSDNNSYVLEERLLRTKYEEMQSKINEIVEAGLPFRETNISIPSSDKKLAKNTLIALSIYLSDLSRKIDLYEDVFKRVVLFKEIVGNQIRNKVMHIDHEKGFYFRSKFTNKDVDLKLNQLSSGEQHQLVLFFQLIFLGKDNTLFLIDEPEISLHVDWQRNFLSNIIRISHVRNHQFLVATHSPQIINGQTELCEAMDLGEIEIEQK